jgi:dTDP-4-amino-4,6-dideoxygalactose transaminase
MFAKVRPVGSQVPNPASVEPLLLPWAEHYTTLFTGSGTQALSLGVQAAIAGKADVTLPEVIIPAYGCPDLIAAIIAQNARPVLVDFVEGNPLMSEQGIVDALTSQTVAIVGVGFLGSHERLLMLSRLCRSSGLTLIEDSAQCFPPASTGHGLADYVVLSFGRGKPINLMGGGALLIRRPNESVVENIRAEYPSSEVKLDAIWRIKRWVFNLLLSRYIYPVLERVPFLHIGQTRFYPLGSITLLDLPSSLLIGAMSDYSKRKPLHSIYNRELGFLQQAGWKPISADENDNFALRLRYALLAPTRHVRAVALKALNANGIGATAFYGHALPAFFKENTAININGAALSNRYPAAEDFANRLITLPTHDGVTEQDIRTIVSVFERLMTP